MPPFRTKAEQHSWLLRLWKLHHAHPCMALKSIWEIGGLQFSRAMFSPERSMSSLFLEHSILCATAATGFMFFFLLHDLHVSSICPSHHPPLSGRQRERLAETALRMQLTSSSASSLTGMDSTIGGWVSIDTNMFLKMATQKPDRHNVIFLYVCFLHCRKTLSQTENVFTCLRTPSNEQNTARYQGLLQW